MNIPNPIPFRTAAALLVAGTLALTTSADVAVDDFAAMTSDDELKTVWVTGIWAAKGASPTGKITLEDGGVLLEASAMLDGQPAQSFTLAQMSRNIPMIAPQDGMDVTINVDIKDFQVTPYGTTPSGRLLFGLRGKGQSPHITASIGSIRAQGNKTLYVKIEASTNDGDITLIEREIAGKRPPRKTTMSLVITDWTIDLLQKGESLIGGPQAHGLNFKEAPFAGQYLKPLVAVQKYFGKKEMSVVLSRYEISGESVKLGDEDIIASQLGSAEYLGEEVFTPAAQLTAKPTKKHTISPYFFGLNGNLTSLGTGPWDNENFVEAVVEISPGHMRYPAGTIGNYWDWNIGWLEQDKDSSRFLTWTQKLVNQDTRYTLENFAKGQRETGFSPIFVLNMVTRDLDDQLKQLHRAKDLGMPIKLVELGNEYYFGGGEPLVHENFPEPEDYARTANEWAAAIKKDFPDAVIAAIGTTGGKSGVSHRRATWNSRVVPLLSEDITAVTMHPYSGIAMLSGKPAQGHWGDEAQQAKQRELLTDPAAVQHTVLTPYKDWMAVMEKTKAIDRNLWLTEFNANDWYGGVRGTWAQGLAIASTYDAFLRDDRVSLSTLHNAIGGSLFPAIHANEDTFDGAKPKSGPKAQPWSPTAIGYVTMLFNEVAKGRDEAVLIDFGKGSSGKFSGVKEAVPMVRGWQFSDSEGKVSAAAILINFTPSATEASISELNLEPKSIVQHAADPQTYIAQPGDVKTQELQPGASIELPPYSITLLKE